MTVEPITVHYVSSDEDWQVTVTGRGQEVTGQAPGIIAARDRADQLIEKIAPDEEGRTAVHLLNGDALEFTTAYINARIGRTDSGDPVTETATESPSAGTADNAEATADTDSSATATAATATETETTATAEAAETEDDDEASAAPAQQTVHNAVDSSSEAAGSEPESTAAASASADTDTATDAAQQTAPTAHA